MTEKPDVTEILQKRLRESIEESFPAAAPEQIDGIMGQLNQITDVFVRKQKELAAGKCPECGHSFLYHDTELLGAGAGLLPGYNPHNYEDLYQCNAYMGMGDWCGCEERSRRLSMP